MPHRYRQECFDLRSCFLKRLSAGGRFQRQGDTIKRRLAGADARVTGAKAGYKRIRFFDRTDSDEWDGPV